MSLNSAGQWYINRTQGQGRFSVTPQRGNMRALSISLLGWALIYGSSANTVIGKTEAIHRFENYLQS